MFALHIRSRLLLFGFSRIKAIQPKGFDFCRFNSHVPKKFDVRKDLPSEGEWKNLKEHIPGETDQPNDLRSRIPKFPLGKEAVPTLLPRPGVPQVGAKYSFRQVIHILKNLREPVLLYEAEPHRLYFLACFCCSAVLVVYGMVLLEYALFESNREYESNERELSEPLRKREWFISLLKKSVLGGLVLLAAFGFAMFPTRLIRRMWYLPGPVEHVRFSCYSLVPRGATPMYTVPLKNLSRKHQSRIWTGKGFYGTSDKSMFFFVLRETGEKTKNWIIDRSGFFWSDGRVFDYLFGKESLAEAEAGVPYDEQIGIVNREIKKKRKQLRQEHGIFYRWKLLTKELKEDVKSAPNYLKNLTSSKNPRISPPNDDNSSKKDNRY